ncbi:receptor subunit 1 [Seminavis robusta]|uniref:Receptor subunit 1 n=1 Tax=Seminavis robusta TaxID=568900 RepID=A0A9N8EH09_9STRA|nr:receptor subunit 1 [Seminavis robusta]|eukprot:Sro923_g220690.1 receptor subunit 1 (656) ;mRNA; f:8009-9976
MIHQLKAKLVCFSLLSFVLAGTSAQQAPVYNVAQFSNDTSLRVRQDVCERYRRYDQGDVELRLALDGMALRPLAIASNFFQLDDEGKIDANNPGHQVDVLDELARRAGFTWRDSFGTTGFLPPDTTRTYTDLLMWGADYFDFFVARWANSLERLQSGITFPQGFYDDSLILVAVAEPPNDTTSINMWQWLEPFETEVWICIVVTILCSGVLFQILDMPTPKQKRNNKHRKPTFNEFRKQQQRGSITAGDDGGGGDGWDDDDVAVPPQRRRSSAEMGEAAAEALYDGAHTLGDGIFLSSLLFTQHFQFVPRTSPARLFSASMALWALLISSNYTANLASFFVIENAPSVEIQSIEEAIQARYPICIWGGTASAKYITDQYPQAITVEVDNDNEDMFRAVRENKCAVGVTARATFELYRDQHSANPDCDVIWVGRVIRYSSGSFGVKADSGKLCTSLISDVINLHLTEMKADGFLDKAWNDHMAKSHDQDCAALSSSKSEDATASRSLNEMAGTFLIHLIFAVAAIILMIILRLFEKYQQRSDESRKHFRQSVVTGRQRTTIPAKAPLPNSTDTGTCSNVSIDTEEVNAPAISYSSRAQPRVAFSSGETQLNDVLAYLKAMEVTNRQKQNEMEEKLNALVELMQNQQSKNKLSSWDL